MLNIIKNTIAKMYKILKSRLELRVKMILLKCLEKYHTLN